MTASDSSILVVGSVALDQIGTPTDRVDEIIGGAAVHFGAAASLFGGVQLVGIIGDEYPVQELDFLRDRNVDLGGLEQREGASFRWGGEYHADMNTRDTTYTELGVFAEFRPSLPDRFKQAPWVFLANIDPALQLHGKRGCEELRDAGHQHHLADAEGAVAANESQEHGHQVDRAEKSHAEDEAQKAADGEVSAFQEGQIDQRPGVVEGLGGAEHPSHEADPA